MTKKIENEITRILNNMQKTTPTRQEESTLLREQALIVESLTMSYIRLKEME